MKMDNRTAAIVLRQPEQPLGIADVTAAKAIVYGQSNRPFGQGSRMEMP
jgi:hypothetical protein